MDLFIYLINFSTSAGYIIWGTALVVAVLILIRYPGFISFLFPINQELLRQAVRLKFAYDEKQWKKNIEDSGFLDNLFGNWSRLHGIIIPYHHCKKLIKKTGRRRNYEIEIFEFIIRQYPIKTKQAPKAHNYDVGPYTGIHFNLHQKYPEVDVIFKDSRGLLKLVDYATVKPKTWTTESEEFNKLFKILSPDHLTNLTVLTPDVMARMIDSKLRLNVEIINNHLLIYTSSQFKQGNELQTILDIGWRIAENLE